ncbi:hypothetical protein ElyMa_003701400 [Elysia marginata]|uniref:Uncharacterized protein n=1 Tax=Elysia marginata TaxID=1093978 RepID=A0AAV4F3B5_9GAST|nr:hypothetical protein ElyMa_003701400 [Elysia marginata]
MHSMKMKGQTGKEAFDPTRSITSPWNQGNHTKGVNQLEVEDFTYDNYNLTISPTKRYEEENKLRGSNSNASRVEDNINTKSNSDVLVDEKSVENVTDFKYFGSYLTADGNTNRETSARVVMASIAFHKLNAI